MVETDLAYVAATSFSILPPSAHVVSCRVVAYLPEATDVVLDIAWDSEIWFTFCESCKLVEQYCYD